MYIYEDHMGGLYTSNRKLDYEEIHCEQCGDTDWLLGYATSREEAWKLLNSDADEDCYGGYDYYYVEAFINECWSE